MKYKEISPFASLSILAAPPPALRPTPKPVDLSSSLTWFDELGQPKRKVFTRPNPDSYDGEWLYALSPKRNEPALEGAALEKHLREIKEMRGNWK